MKNGSDWQKWFKTAQTDRWSNLEEAFIYLCIRDRPALTICWRVCQFMYRSLVAFIKWTVIFTCWSATKSLFWRIGYIVSVWIRSQYSQVFLKYTILVLGGHLHMFLLLYYDSFLACCVYVYLCTFLCWKNQFILFT